MARAKKAPVWSFVTGEKGRNRVRAFEDASRGAIFLEFYDRTPITGERVKQRVSVKHADREKAKSTGRGACGQAARRWLQETNRANARRAF